MKIEEFMKLHHSFPIFKLQRDIEVDSWVWYAGYSPHEDKKRIKVPAGTILVRNAYSNFGHGYSMSYYFEGRILSKEEKELSERWFVVRYEDMEFEEMKFSKF